MYRQVLVDDQFKPLQLILWRSNPDNEILTYSLNTVTYGTASAAFLAIRCLKQLAVEHEDSHPIAAKVISRDFYVDDLLTGSDTIESTVELCNQISSILRSGCFPLRKWKSNSVDVLRGIKESISSSDVLHFGTEENAKTLGLLWSCKHDSFLFEINIQSNISAITKRAILSDKVAKDVSSKWSKFRTEIVELSELSIPRHVVCNDPIHIELHGFSDASLRAYGCCLYIRSRNHRNEVSVHLLCSKTRVAPLNSVSIPRLELCGAHMLARLYERANSSLTLKVDACFMWSDSTVALAWIRTPPHTLQTFVSNRVADIQRLTNTESWRHVPTEHNPADLVTGGMTPKCLISADIWFHGPSYLKRPQECWPTDISLVDPIPPDNIPEKRKTVKVFAEMNTTNLFPSERFSSLSRLKRVIAYVRRFINNCRKPQEVRVAGILSPQEIGDSFNVLVSVAQRESFPNELRDLQKSNEVSRRSKLLSLAPFVDNAGIIRVGGRLRHSPYVFERKHPAVLCSKHPLTYLIFNQYHYQLLHSGPQSLLCSVRELFWPIAGKNLAKRVVRNCITCCRHKPTFSTPLMGDLPKARVTSSFPFQNTGVDYTGPFVIKDRKGRGAKTLKCYLCLFICLASKAIHLELVTELSTRAFLETVQRFIARRGKPSCIFSDNGSNFVGAHSQLKELGKFLLSSNGSLVELIEQESSINWKFIPAYSPHMGGLWEAEVKGAKHHIRRVMGNAFLTYESFYTLITQIEGILNSRPLTPLSSDPNDLAALTPGHLLLGRSLQDIPVPDVRDIPVGRLSQFECLQQMKQHFWSRWSKEYVSQLQERIKWRKDKTSLQIGTMVLIKDDHLPPSRWRLGRIIGLHPGSDNIVRVVSIKTASGIIKRSVVKVCPLPVDF